MREAALSVDSENLTGALRHDESLSFLAVRRDALWRKALPPAPRWRNEL